MRAATIRQGFRKLVKERFGASTRFRFHGHAYTAYDLIVGIAFVGAGKIRAGQFLPVKVISGYSYDFPAVLVLDESFALRTATAPNED
jgi:hypothetical protein